MGLLKKRPELSLHLPSPIVPGESVSGQLHVVATRKVAVDRISIRVKGSHIVNMGGSQRRHLFMSQRANNLLTTKSLLEGTHKLPFTFTIPESSPGTYRGVCTTEYTLSAHVDIDWWPDKRQTWRFDVSPPRSNFIGKPLLMTSAKVGQAIELGLESDLVSVGGNVAFSVACVDFGEVRPKSLRCSFLTEEIAKDVFGLSHVVSKRRKQYPEVVLDGEQSFSGKLQVPLESATREVPPYSVSHRLEVVMKTSKGSLKVHAPLRVVSGSELRSTGGAVPRVGASRRMAMFERVAASTGWTAGHDSLVSPLGDIHIDINDGLVARIDYESLGIGLSLTPRSAFSFLKGGHSVGSDLLRSAFVVKGREAHQLQYLVNEVEQLALSVDSFTMDDNSIDLRFEGAIEEANIRLCVRTAWTLSEAVKTIAKRIPLPTVATHVESDWKSLADKEAGSFRRGDLSLHFEWEELSASILTEWREEEPVGAVCCVSGPEIRTQQLEQLSGEALELKNRLEVDTLEIEAFELRATLPFDLNPAHAMKQLQRLVHLRKAMQSQVGPYR